MLSTETSLYAGWQVAWLAPLLCASAFGLIVIAGRFLPKQGAFISLLAIFGGFVIFWYVFSDFLTSGGGTFSREWFSVGESTFTIGIIVDELSLIMLGLVTFVAMLVQLYSFGYMHGDKLFGWYFAVHSLFAAAMLTLILADNLLLMYIAWELVGACSYLLIGFWYERRSAAEAAKKAFITTRVGDVGLLIGILLLFNEVGTFDLQAIFHVAEQGAIGSGTLTWALLLIFLGAMGKSAQFPLHVWLPDAMEGPTPVSALIHAATMVVAGVFLVARIFPLFVMSDTAMLVVALTGLITALLTASMALVVTDLKRVLAYSTISHLGFMMLALGCFGYTAAIFHLVAHAFAKALLFLGAGSIAHGTGDKRDIREMGGLWKRMPVTSITFALGILALAGIPPLSGFFSKDEILLAVSHHEQWAAPLFILTLVAALMSALYMARLLFMVVLGELKRDNEHAHESPWMMTTPLILLAVLAVIAGFLGPDWIPGYNGFGQWLYFEHPEAYHLNPLVMGISIVLSVGGFILAWAIYSRKVISLNLTEGLLGKMHRVIINKYYIDHFYQWCIDRVILALARLVALFDRVVINDTGVNGSGRSVFLSGSRLKYLETGKIYNYAFAMTGGLVLIILLWSVGLLGI